jgi:hypothetical protein
VLVVISLIAGSVVLGSSLIAQTSIRAIISEVNAISAAVYSFKQQYNGFPGDLSNARTYFGNSDTNGYTVNNGNGDNYIGSSTILSQENLSAWQELALAAGIDGIYTGTTVASPPASSIGIMPTQNTPASKYSKDSTYWFFSGTLWSNYNNFNAIQLSGNAGTAGYDDPKISVKDAWDIDKKIDDELPYSGNVLAYNSSSNNSCTTTMLSLSPAHTLTYLVNSGTLCTMNFKINQY